MDVSYAVYAKISRRFIFFKEPSFSNVGYGGVSIIETDYGFNVWEGNWCTHEYGRATFICDKSIGEPFMLVYKGA